MNFTKKEGFSIKKVLTQQVVSQTSWGVLTTNERSNFKDDFQKKTFEQNEKNDSVKNLNKAVSGVRTFHTWYQTHTGSKA